MFLILSVTSELNYVFLLTKKEANMWNFQFILFSLSLNVILSFLLISHFGLLIKSQKLYTIMILLNCFEQYFLSSNTVISNSFGKYIFATLTSHFFKFSYMSLLLASYSMMILMQLVPLKRFMKMNCALCRIKINQKSRFCVFKSSHFHSWYFVLHLHQWNIF